jgi:hypothetical protein
LKKSNRSGVAEGGGLGEEFRRALASFYSHFLLAEKRCANIKTYMPGFSERLSAMKGKQEAADLKKQEAEKAAEAARLEREAKRSELAVERDRVMAEFSQTEQTANEAHEAIAQADAFAAEQGENLDAGAKAEIDAMKVEAGEAQQKFEELKQRIDALNIEISAFEESAETQETSQETTTKTVSAEGTEEINQQTEIEQTPHIGDTEKNEEALQVEAETEKKERTPKEALQNLNQTIEKTPTLKPNEKDREYYQSLLGQFNAALKNGKSGEANTLFNQLQGTYEYVKQVAENPQVVSTFKDQMAEKYRSEGVEEIAKLFETPADEDRDIIIEKAKYVYALDKAYKANRWGNDLQPYLDSVESQFINNPEFLSVVDSREREKLLRERGRMEEFLGNKDGVIKFFENGGASRVQDWFPHLSEELRSDKELVKKLLTEKKDTGVILMNAGETLQKDPELQSLAFDNYNIGDPEWEKFKQGLKQ